MAGKSLYLVGPNQAYPQIADAVDALQRDQGSTPFTLSQEIRVVEDGVYKGFAVDTLRPGSDGLLIGAAPGVEAIVSGKVSPSTAVGVRISHHVTYTQVKRLIVQDFNYGVYFGSYANHGVANGCRIHRCKEWGIWAWNAAWLAAHNNEIVGSRIGIGMHSVSGASIAHNSVYTPSFDTTNNACILAYQPGSPGEDLYIYDNALFAEGATCLLMYERDVNDYRSNFNVLYAPGGQVAAVIHKGTQIKVVNHKTLADWQRLSGQDKLSNSAPPGFRRRIADEEGATLSLQPLTTSPLIGAGTYVVGGYLPSWGEGSLLVSDVLGEARSTTHPTIGAYEKAFSEEVITGGDDDPTDQDSGVDIPGCGVRVSIIDQAVLHLSRQVPCWHPQVHRGYFFARDQAFYLFADKKGLTLEDITLDQFHLDVEPDQNDTGLVVLVGGTKLSQDNWDLNGPDLRIFHKDLDLDYLGDHVVLEGQYREWDTGSDGFDTRPIRYEFQLGEGRRRYILPSTPVDAGPVVFTDDTLNSLNEPTHLPMQFKLGDPVGPWGPEVHFKYPNLLNNSAFHYGLAEWDYDTGLDAPSAVSSYGGINPYHGDWLLRLPPSQEVRQVIPVNHLETYAASVHLLRGWVSIEWRHYDFLGRLLDFYGPTGNDSSTGEWVRVSTTDTDLHDEAAYAEVRVLNEDTGQYAYVDAVQFELDTVTDYVHMPRGVDATIEYETSDSLFYTISDLDMSPFRNRMHEGFLQIGAVPARQFDVDAPADTTTLSDWRWAKGRTDHLPWAKVHGVNKWRHVRGYSESASDLHITEEGAVDLPVHQPAAIFIEPSTLVTRQGSKGVEFATEIRDTAQNPYAFEEASLSIREDHGNFPGWLAQRTYGFFTHLDQLITPETNNRGEVAARFISPGHSDIEYRGAPPTALVPYVDVPYNVSKLNHGNPTVHDVYGEMIDLSGQDVQLNLTPTIQGDYSLYDMGGDRPLFGTLVVEEQGSDTGWGYPLEESRNHLMDDTQFFANYGTNKLVLFGTSRRPVRVSFERRVAWTDNQYKRRVYFDMVAADPVTGMDQIVVRYDADMTLTVQADKPEGITKGQSIHNVARVIAQNPHRGEIQ